MNQIVPVPHVEDVQSVGSRVSWGALLAGAILAIAIYFLLMTLGSAVGLSLRNRVRTEPLQETALAWSLLTFCVALFIGGMMTSLFTVGENKTEAVVYGVIMWAIVLGVFFVLAAIGLHSGVVMMAQRTETNSWDMMAREAGVPADQIDTWRQRLNQPTTAAPNQMSEGATRIAWYAFGGSWLSMICAALGAWLGAGPTFRIIAVRPTGMTTFAPSH
jgi:hypothetical protein